MQAISELKSLFSGPEVVCIALLFENDEINLSPGIFGLYRAGVWGKISVTSHQGLLIQCHPDWVFVTPFRDHDTIVDLPLLPEESRQSLLAMESELESLIWPGS